VIHGRRFGPGKGFDPVKGVDMKKALTVLVPALVLASATAASAKHFSLHSIKPRPLCAEAAESKFAVVGYFENARPNGDGFGGTSDFVITMILKHDPFLTGKNKLHTNRYLPDQATKKKSLWLVFGDVYKAQPVLSPGLPATPAVIAYVKDLLALGAKDQAAVLRYCFDFLDHAEEDIAHDAFVVFNDLPKDELGQFAKTLSPKKLRQWLQNAKTPAKQLDLYGFLLGHCGTSMDAAQLHAVNKKQVEEDAALIQGALIGEILLQPAEGWAHAVELAREKHFSVRYTVFPAAVYFYTTRPDVIPKQKVVALFSDLLDRPDLADFPIEKLRQWKEWGLTDRILALWKKDSHQAAYIRCSIVRYALQCPQPQAAKFIADVRKTDPQLVSYAEAMLKVEAEFTAPPAN
jgi:hypothetical protein